MMVIDVAVTRPGVCEAAAAACPAIRFGAYLWVIVLQKEKCLCVLTCRMTCTDFVLEVLVTLTLSSDS